MHTNTGPSFRFLRGLTAAVAAAALAAAVVLALTACGGSASPSDTDGPARTSLIAISAGVTPLIRDDGSLAPVDPRAVPADTGARTRSGLYATAAQARQLVDAQGLGVLQIRVRCCGSEAVDEAAGIAWGLQAAYGLPADTPVLVSGADLRLAATTANRLAEGGLTRVWLVTPGDAPREPTAVR